MKAQTKQPLFRLDALAPFAGKGEIRTMKEWKRVYGYEKGRYGCQFVQVDGQPTGGAESAPEAQAKPVPFTPGPWRVQGRFVGSQGPTICDCFVSALVRKDEAAANAKLISACPELLEALQESVACNRNAHPEPYWMQAARAAISKATQP